jgi:predicted metal-binding membrane protein
MAWLTLWRSGTYPYAHYLHHALVHGFMDMSPVQFAIMFVIGWMVMSIAMMLPTTLPLVGLFTAVVREYPRRSLLVLLLCGGYLLVWTAAGLLALALVTACQESAAHASWLQDNPWLYATVVCVIAGAFQFSSLKYACLTRCRSPFSFVAEGWSGRRPALDSLRLGLNHGVFCVGCCWALMLLMLLPGAANVGWMLALAAVMAIEKNLPWGKVVVKPVGTLLIALGLVIASVHLPILLRD